MLNAGAQGDDILPHGTSSAAGAPSPGGLHPTPAARFERAGNAPNLVHRALRYVPVLLKGRPLHDEKRYGPFFIIGSGRCGTTLLRAILHTAPSVHIPPETYALGQIIQEYPRYSRLPWDPLLRLILTRLEYNFHWDAFGISLRDLYLDLVDRPREDLNLAYVLNAFYMYHARVAKPSATRWGDKTPLNTFYLRELDAVFPDARYVHLLRDGRDVVRSYVELARYTIEDAAHRWRRAVTGARTFAERHPTRVLEVRYEDLVSAPEPTIRAVCDFLDLDFSDAMLRHHEQDVQLGDVEILAHHAKVKTPLDTARVGRWQSFFDGATLVQVEQALSPLLAECGYPPAATSSPSPARGAP